jgi:outer membrane lipoprotein-sorting protein
LLKKIVAGSSLLLLTTVACHSVGQPTTLPTDLAPATQPAGALTEDSSLDDILSAMDRRGKSLQTLAADVSLTEADTAQAVHTTRTGKAWLVRTEADTKLRILFDRLRDSEKPDQIKLEKIEYLLAGEWLINRIYQNKKETHYQVKKPGDTTDVLKLGEGPFPLPIGQPADAVKSEFQVTRLPPATTPADGVAKPGTLVIELRPRPGTRLEPRFETITVWLDPATEMPVVVETLDKSGTTLRTSSFNNVLINQNVTEASLQLEPVNAGEWEVVKQQLDQ